MVKLMEKELNTEEKILEAAKKVFIKKGFAGARMQEIADEAGINKALLHYYFRSKDKLFENIFLSIVGKIFPQVLTNMLSNKNLEEKIASFVDTYISFFQENEGLPLFMLNEVSQNPERIVNLLGKEGLEQVASVKERIFSQLEDDLYEYIGRNDINKKEILQQLLINAVSLCIFPFIGKPIMSKILDMDTENWNKMMEVRKTIVTETLIGFVKSLK